VGITVTVTQSDFSFMGSFTKDGVTVTAGSMDPDSGSLEEGGSFSTTLRNFTKRMIDGRISPVSSAVWRAHRPQSSASASLFPANRNEFAKNVGVSTRNFKTFCKFAAVLTF